MDQLLDKLRDATSGSLKLDAEVIAFLRPKFRLGARPIAIDTPVTASMDAALALAGRVYDPATIAEVVNRTTAKIRSRTDGLDRGWDNEIDGIFSEQFALELCRTLVENQGPGK